MAQIGMGVDVDGRAGDGQTALFIACSEGYTQLASALVEAKADLNLSNSQTSFTPLHAATHAGHVSVHKPSVSCGGSMELP